MENLHDEFSFDVHLRFRVVKVLLFIQALSTNWDLSVLGKLIP